MPIRNTRERWGALAKSLHWVIAALIVVQFVLANIAEDLPLGMEKIATLARHKSVGITILGLAVLRLLWRLLDRRPIESAPANSWLLRLAQLTHGALYLLLFAVPLSGWIMSSARNFPVSWFNLWQLPDLVTANDATYRAAHEAHEALTTALGVLALIHIAAALKHHFVDRDDVLRRMLPFGKPRS